MKIGVKIWRVENDLNELIERAKPDFIETMAIVGEDYSPLKETGLPVTIHAEHISFGVNQADPLLLARNTKSLEFAIRTADMLDSDVIVLHPGCLVNHNCSLQAAIDFISGFDDQRILVENMPAYTAKDGKIFNIGISTEEIVDILDKTKKGFCLDLAHAAVAAVGSGRDYLKSIESFIGLRPAYYHMSDSTLKSKCGDHVHLGDGELDVLGIKKMLPDDARVALETPVDIEVRIKDVEFMRN